MPRMPFLSPLDTPCGGGWRRPPHSPCTGDPPRPTSARPAPPRPLASTHATSPALPHATTTRPAVTPPCVCEDCGPIPVDHNGRRAKPPARLRVPRVLNKRTDLIPPNAIYCGRPSPLGNPFIIGRDGTRDEVCDKYEAWLPSRPRLMAMIPSLADHDLICWCAPARCHCNFLLRLANPAFFGRV